MIQGTEGVRAQRQEAVVDPEELDDDEVEEVFDKAELDMKRWEWEAGAGR